MNRLSIVALATGLAVACGGDCGGEKKKPKDPSDAPAAARPKARRDGPTVTSSGRGLHFRLSDGDGAAAADRTALADAQPLDDAATARLLGGLPALPPAEDKDFALRPASLPPPKTGDVIQDSFPPKTTGPALPAGAAAAAADAAPKVVRWAPEGDVPIVPHLSVSFDQPMIAVTSHADSLKAPPPVKLSPTPPGHWRWVGTRTVLFEPDHQRFPGSTEYAVEIPADARSATGKPMAEGKKFVFRTPTATVKRYWPMNGPVRRDPVIFLEFDQKIDPAAVLATITLDADKKMPVRLATADEIAKDDQVRHMSEAAEPGTWLAFTPREKLPTDYRIDLDVGPGTPSLEGPRKTDKAFEWSFRTYGPMKVTERRCTWSGKCRPEMAWYIEFSNPVDVEKFENEFVKVEPAIPGMQVSVNGHGLWIGGRKKAHTKYKVSFATGIIDTFGQNLEPDQKASFDVDEGYPQLSGPGKAFLTLDPSGKPMLSVYSVNHDKLRVQIHAVRPDEWEAFWKYQEEYYRRDRTPTLPGRRVIDDTRKIDGSVDELSETRIDLSKALTNGFGHVVVEVLDTRPVKDRWERQRVTVWVQVTRLGLTAVADGTELHVWATELGKGTPVDGVSLSLMPTPPDGAAGAASLSTGADGTAVLPLPPSSAERGRLLIARKGDDVAFVPEQAAQHAGPILSDETGYWPNDYYYYGASTWVRRERADVLRWYVEDDRTMYRPKEEVHVKGWVRRIPRHRNADMAVTRAESVVWRVVDSSERELAKGEARVGKLGGFDLAFTLPDTPNLGHARVELTAMGDPAAGARHLHGFQIQEFRRPEFEVGATVGEGPFVVGGFAEVSVSASYYAGGGLPGAAVDWTVTATPGSFTPPNRGEYAFGEWRPWWWGGVGRGGIGMGGRGRAPRGGGRYRMAPPTPAGDEPVGPTSFPARTSPLGGHVLRIDFDGVDDPQPTAVSAQASVTDVNRQQWAASASLLVHPADLYVGLKTAKTFVAEGQPIDLDAIVVDLDGKAVPGVKIAVTAARVEWTWKKGEWKEEEKDPSTCEKTSAADAVKCSFQPKQGGQWRLRAEITDKEGRKNKTTLTRWVAGGTARPQRDISLEKVELVPDKKEYQPGETAELLVQAPFAPAEGVLIVAREGIVKKERFSLPKGSATLKVKIGAEDIPGVTVRVDVVGQAGRPGDDGRVDAKLPKRPAFAAGQLVLPVPPQARTLSVGVTPRAKGLSPGEETDVDVMVKTADGRPAAGAVVALVVVDESVLALSGRQLGDPVTAFYTPHPLWLTQAHSRAQLILANLADLVPDADRMGTDAIQAPREEEADGVAMGAIGAGPGGGGSGTGSGYGAARGRSEAAPASPKPSMALDEGKMGKKDSAREKSKNGGGEPQEASPSFDVRTDFNPLATWAPEVVTDASGKATVHVKVPDNLTRYRVMAVAVHEDQHFGAGESTITARLPLMVRPAPPRFLNFGDRFELGVVLHNQTETPMPVEVAARASNADLGDGKGRRVIVPPNDRVEVRFPAAARRAGTARFQVAALGGGKHTDAAIFELPVWTPATTEAFATYGELDKPAVVQPVAPPGDVWKEFGGLEISTASTAVAQLTDAVLYLVSYRYECSEQLSSRILAVAALEPVLTAFKAEGLPPPAEIKKAMARDVDRLKGRQDYSGGFLMWDDSREAWPWGTLHVTHALARAKARGYAVPPGMLERALDYTRRIEQFLPGWWPEWVKWSHRAYAAYVLRVAGDGSAGAEAARVFKDAGAPNRLGMDDLGFLVFAMAGQGAHAGDVQKILRHVQNNVNETAGAAHFTSGYSKEHGYLILASDRRADGILLEALIAADAKNDLIPKLVRGLMNDRKRGHWGNTQENTFVLLGMDLYFRTFEKATPNFVARAWLGPAFAGEHAFRGRTTETHQIDVPMAALDGPKDLTIGKDGPGRLYYRIGMKYAPKDLNLPPAEHGFTVVRVYEAVDDKKDVVQHADGSWTVKAGARVRVRLTMVAEAPRSFVMLVDPMPAGFEAMNAALAVTGTIPSDPQAAQQSGGRYWWWMWPWYEHQNLRDERVEAFATRLYEGVWTYTYVARATTLGNFVVPPAKAEEMYAPETFGRSASDKVNVIP